MLPRLADEVPDHGPVLEDLGRATGGNPLLGEPSGKFAVRIQLQQLYLLLEKGDKVRAGRSDPAAQAFGASSRFGHAQRVRGRRDAGAQTGERGHPGATRNALFGREGECFNNERVNPSEEISFYRHGRSLRFLSPCFLAKPLWSGGWLSNGSRSNQTATNEIGIWRIYYYD